MIFVLILKKARLSWFFFALCLLSGISGITFAQSSILSFLSYNMLLMDKTAVFQASSTNINFIARLRIHYLASDDCQSGYIGFVDTLKDGPNLLVAFGKPFVLDAQAVYQAVKAIVGYERVEATHSILIRFIGAHGQFARFTSSCQDETINCCVPVDCSNTTGTCLSAVLMETQMFTLSNSN